jgi:hypothetical protein
MVTKRLPEHLLRRRKAPTDCAKCGGPFSTRSYEERSGRVRIRRFCPVCKSADTKTWNQINPEKRRSHKAVEVALARGEISRRACERCGELDAQAHHYKMPLEIMWLCPKHHAERHMELRAAKKKPPSQRNETAA